MPEWRAAGVCCRADGGVEPHLLAYSDITVDHREDDYQCPGKIIAPLLHYEQPLGPRYADFNALYSIWRDKYRIGPPADIVGFMGYRKYFMFPNNVLVHTAPDHAPGWYKCSRVVFNYYRHWWAEWDGAEILPILAQHDIIVTPPFPLPVDIFTDFAASRSVHDAEMLHKALPGVLSKQITPYLFITRWSVFDRMMNQLEEARLFLDPLITAEDSVNEEYKKRPMAYVMERVFSLWLEDSDLSTYTLPILNCWELS